MDKRWGWLLATALIVALVALDLTTKLGNWNLGDLRVYVAAGEAARNGGNPFEVITYAGGNPYFYRYAPWFAWVFPPIPGLVWSAILLTASGAALWPLRRFGRDAVPFGVLMGGLLLGLSAAGNVQPLIVAGLVWSLERRWGPVAVGIAGSLKIAPILFVLVYIGRGEWRKALVSVLVMGALWSPALLYDVPAMAFTTGVSGLMGVHLILWALVAAATVLGALLLARTRYAWLAGAAAVMFAMPRLLATDATILLASVPDHAGVEGTHSLMLRKLDCVL